MISVAVCKLGKLIDCPPLDTSLAPISIVPEPAPFIGTMALTLRVMEDKYGLLLIEKPVSEVTALIPVRLVSTVLVMRISLAV